MVSCALDSHRLNYLRAMPCLRLCTSQKNIRFVVSSQWTGLGRYDAQHSPGLDIVAWVLKYMAKWNCFTMASSYIEPNWKLVVILYAISWAKLI